MNSTTCCFDYGLPRRFRINSSQELVFRYDNTGHHKKLGLSTYPHHKHDGVETRVIPSAAPDLAIVLQEVESLIQFP